MKTELTKPLTQVAETLAVNQQLTAALAQALQLLNHHNEDHIPILFEGWAALAKAEGQPISFFWEQRGLEAAPNLLDSIGMNEWEWACSFDLPTGYATRVVATQGVRDDDLWWTLAIVSPEGKHGGISFTVGTVGSEDVRRIIRVCETALCYEGYDVFDGTDEEWETYLQAVGVTHAQ